jgi:hypothetical protein
MINSYPHMFIPVKVRGTPIILQTSANYVSSTESDALGEHPITVLPALKVIKEGHVMRLHRMLLLPISV